MKRTILLITCMIFSAGVARAKVDLVTLPSRDATQVTIYNSADLTLVKEERALTLREGLNNLQFSWANTLIDPTSLEMIPTKSAGEIDIFDLTYPPRVQNLGLWHIRSDVSGKVPVKISYLTSGLSWRAFYIGTLSEDEKDMRLKGYVRVTNHSGEDYENAQVRLIVGKVHTIDEIAQLAQRQFPYGTPINLYDKERLGNKKDFSNAKRMLLDEVQEQYEPYYLATNGVVRGSIVAQKAKEIVKQGLSEYFLYTIEGTETIENGWSKRLPSFDKTKVPVVNLYKYEQERYGNEVVRFLSFNNSEDDELGETPIPGGVIKVFRNVDADNHLSYEGQSNFKYIPVDEEVELNLGNVDTVVVEPKMMNYKTSHYRYDRYGNISGWNETREFKIEVKNTRAIPVKVEIKRNFNANKWQLKNAGDHGEYEKVDKDTVKYTLSLDGKSNKEFTYSITTFHGQNAG